MTPSESLAAALAAAASLLRPPYLPGASALAPSRDALPGTPIPLLIYILFPPRLFAAIYAALGAINGWIGVCFNLVLLGPILFGSVFIHELGHW